MIWPSDFAGFILRPGGALQGLCAFLVIPTALSAQAWLLPKGEGTVSLSYQRLNVNDHAYQNSDAHDVGHILSHALTLDVDYSLTEKLAVRVAVPYVGSRYDGTKPHQLPEDDGTYHSTFQDFTTDVRYNLTKRRVVLTPFLRVVVPSNRYTYFAHSAAGRDQREFHLGANAGRRLDPWIPKAFVQAQYSYAFVERILGIAPNRSNVEAQVGYFLTPRLSVLATGRGMYTHTGVDLNFNLFHAGLLADQWVHHDQIARANLLDLVGGTSLRLRHSGKCSSRWHAHSRGETDTCTRQSSRLGSAVRLAQGKPSKKLPSGSEAAPLRCQLIDH